MFWNKESKTVAWEISIVKSRNKTTADNGEIARIEVFIRIYGVKICRLLISTPQAGLSH